MLLFAPHLPLARLPNKHIQRCARISRRNVTRLSVAPASPEPWLPDMAAYTSKYESSVRDPDLFWSEIARDFDWDGDAPRASPTAQLSPPGVQVSWFAGGRTNICHNALDRWVSAGLGDRPCFLCEGNEPNAQRSLTYAQVLDHVQRAANAFRAAGVRTGDRVVLYLPMIPELPIAMLALARLGAVHAVVFAGFSAEALASRIVAAEASVVITCERAARAAKSIPLKRIADEAIGLAARRGQNVSKQFVVRAPEEGASDVPMTPGRDIPWEKALSDAATTCKVEWVDAEHPLFVLYTSGSTGAPKVRNYGAFKRAAKAC